MSGISPWNFVPPPLNATPEPPTSPFYPPSAKYPILKAAFPIDLNDAHGGRMCTKTQMWVPRSRLRYFRGRPYFDLVCPEKHQEPFTWSPPGLPPQVPDYNGSVLAAQAQDYEGPDPVCRYSFAPENPIG